MEFRSYQSGPPNETRPSFGGLFYRLLSYPVLTFILPREAPPIYRMRRYYTYRFLGIRASAAKGPTRRARL